MAGECIVTNFIFFIPRDRSIYALAIAASLHVHNKCGKVCAANFISPRNKGGNKISTESVYLRLLEGVGGGKKEEGVLEGKGELVINFDGL